MHGIVGILGAFHTLVIRALGLTRPTPPAGPRQSLSQVSMAKTQKKSRSRLRRWFSRLGKVLLVVLILLVVLYFLRGPLLSKPLGSLVGDQLSSALGGEFEVDAIEGDWFTDLVVVGLRTKTAPTEGPVRHLKCDRARVAYSLKQLLSEPIDALAALEASGLDVDLDLTAPSEPSDEPMTLEKLGELLPQKLPLADVKNAHVRLKLPDGQYEVGSLNLSGDGKKLNLDLKNITVPESLPVPIPNDWALSIHRIEHMGLRVSATDPIADVLLKDITIRRTSGEDWEIKGDLDVFQASAQLAMNPTGAQIDVPTLDLEALPEWLQQMAQDAPWPTRGTLGLAAQVDAPYDKPKASAEIQIKDLDLAQIVGAQAAFHGTFEDGLITLKTITAAAHENNLSLERAVLDPEHALVLRELTSLDAEVPDLKALLERLEIPLEDIPLPPQTVTVRIKGGGKPEGEIALTQLLVTCGDARVESSGTIKPSLEADQWQQSRLDLNWTLDVPQLQTVIPPELELGDVAGSLTGSGQVSRTTGDPRVTTELEGQDLTIRGVTTNSLKVQGEYAGTVAKLTSLDLRGTYGTVTGSGVANLGDQSLADLDLVCDVPALEQLEQMLGGPGTLRGYLKAIVKGSKSAGEWDEGYEVDLSVTGDQLARENVHVGAAELVSRVSWPTAELKSLSVNGPLGGLEAQGTADLTDLELPGINLTQFSGQFQDLKALMALIPDAPEVSGSLTFEGSANKPVGTPWEEVTSHLELEGRSITIPDVESIDHLAVKLDSQSRIVQIHEAQAKGPWGEASLQADAELTDTGGSATIAQLKALFDGHGIENLSPLKATWTNDAHVNVPAFRVKVFEGIIEGSVALSDTLSAQLDAQGIDLGTLPIEEDVSGILNFSLNAQGDPRTPDFTLEAAVPDLRYMDEQAVVNFKATQSKGGITLDSLKLTTGDSTEVLASGSVPIHVGTEGMVGEGLEDAVVDLKVATRDLELLRRHGLPAEAALEGADLKLHMDKGTWTLNSKVERPTWTMDQHVFDLIPALTLDGSGSPEQTALNWDMSGSDAVTINGNASLDAGFDLRDTKGSIDRLMEANLGGQTKLVVKGLDRFLDLVPALRTLKGDLDSEITFAGKLTDPTPSGTIRLNNLEVKPDIDLPAITDASVDVAVNYPQVTINTLDGELGYGPFSITGTATIPHEGQPLACDLKIDGENLLLARSQHLRVRSDLDLVITGALDALKVGGTVTLTDVLFSQPINLTASSAPTAEANGYPLFSLRRPPLSTMVFDVKVLADRSIRLNNNVVRGAVSSDLAIRGTGAVPKPEGRVYFSDLRVQLPFSRLKVERGDVVFDKGSPFSPRLAVSADTRMQGYDLNVQVSGRLPDTRVQVASEPHLSQQDALALLTLGATPSGLQKEGLSRAALTRIGSLMADSVLSDIFGPGDPDSEGLADRISLEVGRDVSRTGASTIEFEYRLLEKLFLRAERDRYDDYNLGGVWRWRFR